MHRRSTSKFQSQSQVTFFVARQMAQATRSVRSGCKAPRRHRGVCVFCSGVWNATAERMMRNFAGRRYPALLGLARKIIRATRRKKEKIRASREKQKKTPPKSTKSHPKKHKKTGKDEKNTSFFRTYARKKKLQKKNAFRAYARETNHVPGLAQSSQKRMNLRPGISKRDFLCDSGAGYVPGLPRDQFSGPWLFRTAKARTSRVAPISGKPLFLN